MRKLLLLTTAFVFAFLSGFSQDRTITGTVTSEEDGSSMPGVSVLLKGTSTGDVTDIDGTYKLSVPSSGGTLVFSFIGMKTQEIEVGSKSKVDLAMQSDVQQLSEVVVTALNVPREKKTLGYSTQSIDQENLRVARETNLNSALAGKVSGVQVVSGSGAKFGEAAIRIRGVRGLGGSAPLYVVDGIIISDPASVNMDNVASINILKGAAAAALYGIRAVDGVVMITSKSAKSGALNVSVNNTTTFEKVRTLFDYQNEYGGGYSDQFDTFNYNPAVHPAELAGLDGANIPQFYADESWGPKLDGRQVAQWDAFFPGMPGYGKTRPWEAHPDNVRDFFDQGVALNNSVSIGKGGEGYSVNMTLTNIQRTGVLPGSSQDKTFFNLKTTVDLSDKLTLGAQANYNKTNTQGSFLEGYNGSIGQNINQWFQRQLDTDLFRKYPETPNGTLTTWNINSPTNLKPLYWNNPFTDFLYNINKDERETFFGSLNLDYEIIEGLVASVAVTREARTTNGNSRHDERSVTEGFIGRFGQFSNTRSEDYRRFNLRYNKQLNSDFSLGAIFGAETMDRQSESSFAGTNGGLNFPGFYNPGASIDRPNAFGNNTRLIHRSAFGSANVGWREIVFVEGMYRVDATSAIADPERNQFNYFQASASFIFSEVIPQNDILSFGKLRGSYAQVGKELSPYYDQTGYGTGNPYNGATPQTEPNTIIDPTISAIPTLSTEAGVELKFLSNRLSFDFSVYKYDTDGEPVSITLPAELGVTGFTTNSAQTITTGWEASIGGSPIQTTDFNWDVSFNFATFKNEVIKLDAEGNLNSINLSNGFGGTSTSGGFGAGGAIRARAEVGEEWGLLYGTVPQRNDAGEFLVSDAGRLLYTANQPIDNILPDFTGGMFNSFTYKNFVLSFTFDWQIGGKFYSISKMFSDLTGITAATVGKNDKGNDIRTPASEGGGLSFGGVRASDGAPNDIYLDAQTYFGARYGIHEFFTYDATFVKLREIRLGYSLPSSIMDQTFIKTATISLIANNPWLVYAATTGIDPSEISGGTRDARDNASWAEGGQLPATRSVGFDIKLGF